jgi:hypothetical protein
MGILSFRNEELLRCVNESTYKSIELVRDAAAHIQRENADLAMLTRQSRRDSMALKALTTVATVFLPASLIAVKPPFHCSLVFSSGR